MEYKLLKMMTNNINEETCKLLDIIYELEKKLPNWDLLDEIMVSKIKTRTLGSLKGIVEIEEKLNEGEDGEDGEEVEDNEMFNSLKELNLFLREEKEKMGKEWLDEDEIENIIMTAFGKIKGKKWKKHTI